MITGLKWIKTGPNQFSLMIREDGVITPFWVVRIAGGRLYRGKLPDRFFKEHGGMFRKAVDVRLNVIRIG